MYSIIFAPVFKLAKVLSLAPYIFFILFSLYAFGQTHSALPHTLNWQIDSIAEDLVWKYIETDELFGAPQCINVLVIGPERSLSIGYETQAFKSTSQFAEEEGALAAVNAGFFDMKDGGSVTFMKVEDEVIHQHATDSRLITQSCVAIDEQQHLTILPSPPSDSLEMPAYYDDILFTGPLMIDDGEFVEMDTVAFNTRRHPRTCACTWVDGSTLLVTVDGRNERAAGMSIPELASFLQTLHCQDAINLDGGGSTTMWIQGKGVTNHPSDNHTFDGEGERKVANVLLVE